MDKNKGMLLEYYINKSNQFYRMANRALVYKKPTPISVVSVKYEKGKHTIEKGYYSTPSTTDYNGVYKGLYIDFEAKQTNSLTGLNINQIKKHQLLHIKKVYEHGGISFIIVYFVKLNKIYLLFCDKLLRFINNSNRKTINLNYFEENGFEVKLGVNPYIEYLEVIDEIIK